MHFIYVDAQARLQTAPLNQAKHPIADIDVHWLNLGYHAFPQRLHAMACFEAVVSLVPENHQFTFRSWYDMQMRQTHCMWYSVSKAILETLPNPGMTTKSLLFMLPQFFPPVCRNKSVLVFVELLGCEMVAGYIRGICVCFKKLPEGSPIQAQHECLHIQQAYPQWSFECSVYLTMHGGALHNLIQTHQQTVHFQADNNTLVNRMMLYGIN